VTTELHSTAVWGKGSLTDAGIHPPNKVARTGTWHAEGLVGHREVGIEVCAYMNIYIYAIIYGIAYIYI